MCMYTHVALHVICKPWCSCDPRAIWLKYFCQFHSPERICSNQNDRCPSLHVTATCLPLRGRDCAEGAGEDHLVALRCGPLYWCLGVSSINGRSCYLVLWVTEAWSQILCFITFLCAVSSQEFFKQFLQFQIGARFPFIVLTRFKHILEVSALILAQFPYIIILFSINFSENWWKLRTIDKNRLKSLTSIPE